MKSWINHHFENLSKCFSVYDDVFFSGHLEELQVSVEINVLKFQIYTPPGTWETQQATLVCDTRMM